MVEECLVELLALMSWHHVQNPEAQTLEATIPQPFCLETHLAVTLM